MPAALPTSRLQPVSRQPLFLLAVAAMIGIVADRLVGDRCVESGLLIWWVAAIACLAASSLLTRDRDVRLCAALLLLAVVCLGGGWHHLRWHYFERDHLARFATDVPQPVCLQAVALDRLKWSPAPPSNPLRALPVGPRSEIMVRVTRVRDGREWRDATGTCKLRVNGELRDIMAGDELQVFALMGRLTPALNPGEYDWSESERGAGRHCELYCRAAACVSVMKAAQQGSISRWLHQIGERCERRLATYLRPAQSDLAQAILLGARERLDSTTYTDFVRTGTIHLLVVSGLHVGLLALAIWTIVCSGLLPRKTGLLITAVVVIAYALIAGGRPPVLRASVLVVLTLMSYSIGRRVSPVNLLSAAALVGACDQSE